MGVASTLRQLAREMEDRLEVLLMRTLAKIREDVREYDLGRYPHLRRPLRDGSRAGLRAAVLSVTGTSTPSDAVTEEMRSEARSAARSGLALDALLKSYRVGHAVAWDEFLAVAIAHELSSAERLAVLQIASRQMFDLVDYAVGEVTAEYTRESGRWLGAGSERRTSLVRHVLGGANVSDTELAYPASASQIAIVASGDGARAVLEAAVEAGGGATLIVPGDGGQTWAWTSPPRPGLRQGLVRTGAPMTVGLGDVLAGVAGFRQSHRQAMAAHDVGASRGQAVTVYDDVVIEALLLEDAAAQAMVARELGPLTAPNERATVLRSTLRAYLASSLNATSAGARLGVSDRTVAYRLRTIETALGRGIATRYVELAVALRLYQPEDEPSTDTSAPSA